MDQTEMLYNMEGDIFVQRSDINSDNDISIVSDTSSTSSGNCCRSYRSRTRHEKKKKRHGPKGDCIKSIKWWDDKGSINSPEESNFPTHPPTLVPPFMTGPDNNFESRIRGVPPDIESKLKDLISNTSDQESSSCMINNESVLGETINNDFRQPIDSNNGATCTILEEDGVLYIQKCFYCEYYYESCEISGNTDKSTTLMTHSTDTWSLCDSTPSFKDNPISDIPYNFDRWLLEENRRMAYQGLLDECSDYNLFEVDLEEAQESLKPIIHPPAVKDWEIMRKYFGYVPAKVVRNTYTYSIQHGVLPPPSHLQKRFKSSNPLLNLH